jgi:polyketide synthase 5
LVATATASGLPVRGALHLAAVVEDATLSNLTDELIERDWAPKVYGAWDLHTATAGQPLDWFCSFSSAAALVGAPGQGAYAAANSWVDAFTVWRRAKGLPATAIAWGAWAEVGRATAVAASADVAIAPDEGAYAFEALLRHDRGYTAYAPITGTPWLTAFSERSPLRRSIPFHRAECSGHKQTACRAQRVASRRVAHPAAASALRSVSMILRRNIDPDRPLAKYGADSLGALELRTRIESETGYAPLLAISPPPPCAICAADVRKAGARGSRLTTTTPR